MSFFEDIAAALDADGIESRVNDDTMFVPITADLEIQFVEIDPLLPAANVYIAAADVDEDDEDFEAVLVSVAFSVEDAVNAVSRHVATDQVVTVLRDLIEGTDERIGDLDFFQDYENANLVTAEVGQNSELRVLVEVVDDVPTAYVAFVANGESFEDVVDQAISELWEADGDTDMSDEDRQRMFEDYAAEVEIMESEALDLGSFTDFDRLFDVLSLASEQADDWESQLVAFDNYDEFADFGDDDLDDDDLDDDFDEDDLEDDDLDEDFEDDDIEDDDIEDDDDIDDDDLEDEELSVDFDDAFPEKEID